MDVSIAVSLIRGQMGTVVERAVNTAVETVLSEMLRVVGVKFEEVKGQVALLKGEMASLRREKADKDKENETIRRMLRYSEMRLRYTSQNINEKRQRNPQTSYSQSPHAQPPKAVTPPGNLNSFSVSKVNSKGRSDKVVAPGSTQHRERVAPPTNAFMTSSDGSLSFDGLDLPDNLSLSADTLPLKLPPVPSVDSRTEPSDPVKDEYTCPIEDDDLGSLGKDERSPEIEWTTSELQQTEVGPAPVPDPFPAPNPASVLAPDPSPNPDFFAAPALSPARSSQADSSTVGPVTKPSCLKVKQELEEEEQQEVIYIKEEEEQQLQQSVEQEQEQMANLLLDCEVEATDQGLDFHPGDWPGPDRTQRSILESSAFSFSTQGPCALPLSGSMATVSMPSAVPRQLRVWPKELSLYEEYKLRRAELRRRSSSRRREAEKALPQPLLADLVRERREKTRLRVARWRAKRKLQASLSSLGPEQRQVMRQPDQRQGGSTNLQQQQQQQQHQPQQQQQIHRQQQQRSQFYTSSLQRRVFPQCPSFPYNNNNNNSRTGGEINNFPSSLPFMVSPSSSSPSSAQHAALCLNERLPGQQAVTSSSSRPANHGQGQSQQSVCLGNSDLFQ